MAKPVHEHVQELLARWNPPPEDHLMERVVGVTPEVGDVAATAHGRNDLFDSDENFARDDLDAQTMGGDGEDTLAVETYEDFDMKALREEADERNADREDDDKISKGGSADDLRDRLMEDDRAHMAGNSDDEGDDSEDDESEDDDSDEDDDED